MLRMIRYFAYAGLLGFTVLIAVALTASKEEFLLAAIYEVVFGPPDLGPVDFETLSRGTRPNTALACPAGLCKNAVADFDPGVFVMSDEALRDVFTRHALAQPNVIPVYRHAQPGLPTQDRYIQRTARLQFPDTINVRFIALSSDTSTLAIYSRSQIGYRDMGVNLARIKAWTDRSALGGR